MPVDVIIDPSSGQIYWNDNAGSGSTQSIAISGNANDSINFIGYSNFFSAGGAGLGTRILATFNDSITSTFVPGTNAYDLGSSSLRWNFYGTAGNFTGVISTSASTASTSTTTGALTVAGGLGVVGDVYVASASNSRLNIMQSTGDEGGEIFLNKAVTNTSLTTGVTIDVFQNRVRIFETGGSNRGYYLDISAGGNSVGTNLVSAGASGLASLNGLTASSQTFATGTSGTDFNISSSTSTHTFNIPYAGSGATGLVTTQAQTIAGSKTFSSQTIVSDATASTTTGTGALLVYGGLGVTGQINSASLVTSGNVVINGNLQFKGVGTFGDATSDTITSLARYASDLLPSADNSYDLGNNSLGWRNFKVSGVGTIGTLNVTATTGSGSTTTGALTVVGGMGIGGTINAGTRNLSYTASGLLAGFAGSANSYVQIVLQNAASGATASSDFIVNNDLSTDSTYYGSMGMNSSGFTGSGSLNLANAVYFTSTTGDLVLGSTTANILRFVYNSGATDSMQITGTAVTVLYTTGATSTTTGALIVAGGVGIGGSLWTSSTNFSSISGVGHSSGAITSGVWSGTAISVTNGGTGQASLTANSVLLGNGTSAIATTSGSSAQVLTWQASGAPAFVSLSGDVTITAAGVATIAANSVALGTDTTGQYASTIAISGTGITATSAGADDGTAYTIYSSATSANTASAIVQRDGSGNFTAGTITASLTGTASIASSSVLSATTTDTSSTLYLLGSRSSTGFAGTAIYVDTNISIAGSQITAGVWAGTAISAVNGGTGQVSYSIGDILYASSTTALSKLSAGTAGSVLASAGAGAAPYWKVDATGGAGTTPGGADTAIQFNDASSFGGTTGGFSFTKTTHTVSIGSTAQLALTSVGLQLYNNNASSISTTQRWSPALEFMGRSFTPTGSIDYRVRFLNEVQASTNTYAQKLIWKFSYDTGTPSYTNPVMVLNSQNGVGVGATDSTTINYLKTSSAQSIDQTYTLPTAYPTGTGTSYLTASTTGVMAWVSGGAAGGSGTVTSGTAGSVAYYTGTGTTVGGAPGFTYTTSGTASTINVFGGGAIGTTIFTVQALSATSVRVGIGTNLPQYELEIVGEISATNKSFVIDHPTKPGKKLRYGSLEGPENGVYVRGELKDSNIIQTPDHWEGLVHTDSFTVTLTPIGRFSHLYVEKIEDYKVFIADAYMNPIHCYYTIWAERKDIPKLITEY